MILTAAMSVTVLLAGVLSGSVDPAEMVSFIPSEGLEQFIVDRLDITSFRNSLGPARSPGMRYLADMGLTPTEVSEGRIVFETEDWFYSIEVVDRRDVNGDGVEDLLIRFTDDSTYGTYLSHYVYMLTCFSENSDLIALAFGPPNCMWGDADPMMKID